MNIPGLSLEEQMTGTPTMLGCYRCGHTFLERDKDGHTLVCPVAVAEREAKAAADRERIEFIRRAAIAHHAAQTGTKSESDAWVNAANLWNAKPEGC